MDRIVLIGEPLVEFTRTAEGLYRRGLGGDTANTAIYLARLSGVEVRYLTRLGDDTQSNWIVDRLAGEGIDTGTIVRVPGACPGLYFIETDAAGERRFTYWRGESPARDLFAADGRGEEDLSTATLVYLTGITLAILGPAARDRLRAALRAVVARGGIVAYDTNHRPALWSDPDEARAVTAAMLGEASLVLPSIEDNVTLGLTEPAPDRALATLMDITGADIVLKTGGGPVGWRIGGRSGWVDPGPPVAATDTTGAGDSFNAGFLAARLAGLAPEMALKQAHALAARVVRTPGAILPRDRMADLIAAR